jgi:hypothetical protein
VLLLIWVPLAHLALLAVAVVGLIIALVTRRPKGGPRGR